MKIYTKTGDAGQTGLFGGERTDKHSLRVEAIGTVDELNAHLGVVLSIVKNNPKVPALIREPLERVQHELFQLGADLATPLDAKTAKPVSRITADDVTSLESDIDEAMKSLAEQKQFILPSGTSLSSHLHVARAVCRRAERCVSALIAAERDLTNSQTLVYLNRLSDLLFALARHANHAAAVPDTPWTSPHTSPKPTPATSAKTK